MTLRLIGGQFGGRLIKSPNGLLSKPTTSLMRKSVFDICQSYIEDARFLDVFACSGAMGIEALSRGASFAAFIDNDKKAIACIHENIKTLQIENKTSVLYGDALSQLKRLAAQKQSFTLVYMDPPYTHIHQPFCSPSTLLPFLEESTLLAEGAVVFIEEGYPSQSHIEKIPLKRLKLKNSRKFSKSLLHQFYLAG